MHVRYWVVRPLVVGRPYRTSTAHDVGFTWARNLHDADLYSAELQGLVR